MNLNFKIFTFNCWGIPFIAKNLSERIEAIGDFLAKNEYDCVCLQEVWTENQYLSIKSKVTRTLPYGHYFFSGPLGSGICMLSKYPIEDVYFHQWPVNGYFHKIQHGDWFGGKGVGLCKLKLGHYSVNVYTAHLHAEYDKDNDEYKAHRVIQAYDTAQFIKFTSEGADLVVLAGDLNTEPGDLAYRLLLSIPGLTDSFVQSNTELESVTTNESFNNSYTSDYVKKKGHCGQRIDYILFHPGSKLQVQLKNYAMPLSDRIPDKSFSYSDHEAVAAILNISGDEAKPSNDKSIADMILVLKESVAVLEHEIERLRSRRLFFWFCAAIPFCLLFISLLINVPSHMSIPYNISRIILVIVILFCVGMATVWNSIEYRAIISNLLSMKILLERI